MRDCAGAVDVAVVADDRARMVVRVMVVVVVMMVMVVAVTVATVVVAAAADVVAAGVEFMLLSGWMLRHVHHV